jgi:hypothetical protein
LQAEIAMSRLPIFIAPYNRPYAEPPKRPSLLASAWALVRALFSIARTHPGDHIVARQPARDRRRIEAINRALVQHQASMP